MILSTRILAGFTSLMSTGFAQPTGRSLEAASSEKVYSIKDGATAPRVRHKNSPSYSRLAERARVEDTVVLAVEIRPDGLAHNVKIVRASVDAGLDRKALECIGKWRFTPGEKDGRPVIVISTIEMNFKLGRTNGPPAFDEERALKVYEKEAAKGNADAQYSAGALYYRKKDFSSARDWLLKAADQNVPDASYLLGVMYEHGAGVPANSLVAQHWYGKATLFVKPSSGKQ